MLGVVIPMSLSFLTSCSFPCARLAGKVEPGPSGLEIEGLQQAVCGFLPYPKPWVVMATRFGGIWNGGQRAKTCQTRNEICPQEQGDFRDSSLGAQIKSDLCLSEFPSSFFSLLFYPIPRFPLIASSLGQAQETGLNSCAYQPLSWGPTVLSCSIVKHLTPLASKFPTLKFKTRLTLAGLFKTFQTFLLGAFQVLVQK